MNYKDSHNVQKIRIYIELEKVSPWFRHLF